MKSRKEALEEFLSQEPGDSFSRYALALELVKEDQCEAAASQLEQVIALEPSYLAAYFHLGRLLATSGRIKEAREVYTRGVTVAASANDQRTRAELQEALDAL